MGIKQAIHRRSLWPCNSAPFHPAPKGQVRTWVLVRGPVPRFWGKPAGEAPLLRGASSLAGEPSQLQVRLPPVIPGSSLLTLPWLPSRSWPRWGPIRVRTPDGVKVYTAGSSWTALGVPRADHSDCKLRSWRDDACVLRVLLSRAPPHPSTCLQKRLPPPRDSAP